MEKKHPTVADAKRIAKKYGKTQVIIFHLDDYLMSYVGYGVNRQACQEAKHLADQMWLALAKAAHGLSLGRHGQPQDQTRGDL
jgi:hypothetical protein